MEAVTIGAILKGGYNVLKSGVLQKDLTIEQKRLSDINNSMRQCYDIHSKNVLMPFSSQQFKICLAQCEERKTQLIKDTGLSIEEIGEGYTNYTTTIKGNPIGETKKVYSPPLTEPVQKIGFIDMIINFIRGLFNG